MKINWNYLIGSANRVDKSYDIENRPDPENGCKKLYGDIIEIYFRGGIIAATKCKVENLEQQLKRNNKWDKWDKWDWERQWKNYEAVNEDVCLRDENLQPPYYTVKINEKSTHEEWLLSADYIGPSINWALREVEIGTISNDDIIEILNVCRTIGGHIVWPRGSHLTYKINTSRGGEASIYDRIDWTLYLVQLCYKHDFNTTKLNEIILEIYPKEIVIRISVLISAICESKSWFKKLGSFVEFCNQFILKGSFVDENYEVKWFAKKNPVFPKDYKQFSINNMNAVEQRNLSIMIAKYGNIIDKLFSNGGETYSFDDLKVVFNEIHKVDEFEDVLEDCILQGWIIDCGNGCYTR